MSDHYIMTTSSEYPKTYVAESTMPRLWRTIARKIPKPSL